MTGRSAFRRAPSRSNTTIAIVGNLLLAASAAGASAQATQLDRQLGELRAYYALPASSVLHRRRDRRELFRNLARRWRDETQFFSSTTEIAMHPAYQTIIGMGSDALGLILEDLRENAGYWYWALKAISDEDPVPASDRGAIKKMRAAWIAWGEAKGLIER